MNFDESNLSAGFGAVEQDKIKAAIDLLADAQNEMGKLSEETKKSGKSAEQAAEQHKELWHVLEEIGNVAAPSVGSALAEMANGPVGVALALIKVYEMVQGKIEEIDKQAEKLDAENFEEHRKNVEALVRTWADAAAAHRAYLDELKAAGEEKDPAGEELKHAEEMLKARTEAQLKQLEAEGKNRLDFMKAHPEWFSATAISDEEQKQKRQQELVKEGAEHERVNLITLDKLSRARAQEELDEDVATKEKAAKDAKAAVDKANKTIAGNATGEEIEKAKADREQVEKSLMYKAHEAIAAHDKAFLTDPDSPENLKESARDEMERAEAANRARLTASDSEDQEIRNKQTAAKTAEDALPTLTAAQKAAEDALHAAQGKAIANQVAITKENREGKNASDVAGVNETASAGIALLGTRSRQFPNETLGSLAAETGKTHAQTEAILQEILSHHWDLQGTMINLKRQLEQQKAQLHSIGYNGQ